MRADRKVQQEPEVGAGAGAFPREAEASRDKSIDRKRPPGQQRRTKEISRRPRHVGEKQGWWNDVVV